MANYKETAVVGTSYTRANSILIQNPLNGTKGISFKEEKVIVLPEGNTITQNENTLDQAFSEFTQENMLTEFPLLDQNGTPIGSNIKYIDVYLTLQSLYYYLAEQRDIRKIVLAEREAELALKLATSN